MSDERGLWKQPSPDGGYPVESNRDAVHVLFVTADGGNTDTTTALENRDQFSVETASAGEELDQLEAEAFDCVVSEYQLADGDGIDVLREVRGTYPALPFLLVSSEVIAGLADEALSAGATDYVHSPPGDSVSLLTSRIQSAVGYHDDQPRQTPPRSDVHRVYRALETAQEGISLLDAKGEFVYVNQAYADLYAYEPDEMLGMHWEEIYPDDEVGRVYDDILPGVDEGGNWSGETTGLRADGSTFIEDHSLSKTAGGGLVCTIQDITEQEKRKELVEYYRSVVEDVFGKSEVGVFILDSSHDVAWTNQAIERYFGLEGTPVEGWGMAEVVDGYLEPRLEEPAAFEEQATDTHEQNESVEDSEVHVLPGENRPERYLQHRSQPITSGEYAGGRLELYYDITERKEREEKLEQFADVLSHDLRNPLGIAQIYLEQARNGGDEESFEEIDQALDRMETIIQNVLTMARASQSSDEWTRTSLETVAERAWGQIETTDASLRIKADDSKISADEDRLQSVFENLFRNSVEHGGSDVSVRVGTLDTGFYVADDGPGIAPENRADVLEYGYSEGGGTGFGLAIVREIIDAHGWEITVTESSDGGAKFEIHGVEADSSDTQSRN